MNYLSLFSGVGGGDLAFQHLLEGFRCVGYVEYEKYCQKVLKRRIKDGLLDAAPIFGDIRDFISEGYAEAYKGMVDLITGGFPCQPFSVTGKRKGKEDERNMWPETISCLRLVRPKYGFFENVTGLLTSGYMPRIFGDLARTGYNAKWTMLGANNFGFPHIRKRIWILADSNGSRLEKIQPRHGASLGILPKPSDNIKRFASIKRTFGKRNIGELRNGNGIPDWMGQLQGIGNAWLPIVAATAWEILTRELSI